MALLILISLQDSFVQANDWDIKINSVTENSLSVSSL